jgi:dipeptidyl aminopeptidase/acylaminoacyl peptidase
MKTEIKPYGSWKSPISPERIAAGSLSLSQLQVAQGRAYWTETRPEESGRVALVSAPLGGGATREEIPESLCARNRVNEYGSGSYCVGENALWVTNLDDARIYRVARDGSCEPITPQLSEDHRYSDPQLTRDERWIVCQRERHVPRDPRRSALPSEVFNELVIVAADGSTPPAVIASGCDFYGPARIHPDGKALAWLQWNHPNMPWDGSELLVAELGEDGSLEGPRRVAGGPAVSIVQPSWSPDGVLHFVSDESGWWNLYRLVGGQAQNLCPMRAEFGSPSWAFWYSMHTHLKDGRIACICIKKGEERLGLLDPKQQSFVPFELSLSFFGQGGELRSDGAERLIFLAGSPTRPTAVYSLTLRDATSPATGGLSPQRIYQPDKDAIDERFLSRPRAISFPAAPFAGKSPIASGKSKEDLGSAPTRAISRMAHAFYYPPRNDDFRAPEGERPPLIVMCHGGPTGATNTGFMLKVQFWTSRGFAVVDVNYRGSTGYGRAYREAINGNSGLVEPRDCEAAARHLAREGLVDETRMAVRGGSAGGYIVLCCAAFPSSAGLEDATPSLTPGVSCFSAGTSLYGIGDLEALLRDTHKFESQYPFALIAPYPGKKEIYRARSPLHFVARAAFPLFLMQGLNDPVVPPNQAESMAQALRGAGLPFAYLAFEGEGHGFRRQENIVRSFAAELSFYGQVFGFSPESADLSLRIENWH